MLELETCAVTAAATPGFSQRLFDFQDSRVERPVEVVAVVGVAARLVIPTSIARDKQLGELRMPGLSLATEAAPLLHGKVVLMAPRLVMNADGK